MSLDYDLFVIDSTNDAKEYQLRDCIHHAIKELDDRLKKLEEKK